VTEVRLDLRAGTYLHTQKERAAHTCSCIPLLTKPPATLAALADKILSAQGEQAALLEDRECAKRLGNRGGNNPRTGSTGA